MVSLIGLVVFSPVFILISLFLKFDSVGPVFFKQVRVGRDFKEFRLIKFRTMKLDSEKSGFLTVGELDPRITRVGAFLRRFKLDELPQLINVLKGEMSLVGPRPEVPRFVDLYSEEQKAVLAVRPGISDPASLMYRNENQLLEGKADPTKYYIDHIMPAKLDLNLNYIRKRSFFQDLVIIFRSFFIMFKGSNG